MDTAAPTAHTPVADSADILGVYCLLGRADERTPQMSQFARTWVAAAAAVLGLVTVPAAIVTIAPSGAANADVCASAGRRISVSGCANLSDVMAPYVVQPDAYAPLPGDFTPNVNACVGYNGRWVDASTCR